MEVEAMSGKGDCRLIRCPGHSGDEPWHGTASGYNHHRCRCDECREAKRRYGWDRDTYREWVTRNLDRKLLNNKRWREANPDRYAELQREGQARRRARLAAVDVEPYSRAAIFERDGWTCQICGEPIDPSLPPMARRGPSLDHIIPISEGGADRAENVRASHLVCNQRRSRK
jgi:5-methylcytosine-specific restriction endonuclease McrA